MALWKDPPVGTKLRESLITEYVTAWKTWVDDTTEDSPIIPRMVNVWNRMTWWERCEAEDRIEKHVRSTLVQ